MWYYPAAFLVEERDVIGAWLICFVVAAACFGSPILSAAFDASPATRHAAAGCEHPGVIGPDTFRLDAPTVHSG